MACLGLGLGEFGVQHVYELYYYVGQRPAQGVGRGASGKTR